MPVTAPWPLKRPDTRLAPRPARVAAVTLEPPTPLPPVRSNRTAPVAASRSVDTDLSKWTSIASPAGPAKLAPLPGSLLDSFQPAATAIAKPSFVPSSGAKPAGSGAAAGQAGRLAGGGPRQADTIKPA